MTVQELWTALANLPPSAQSKPVFLMEGNHGSLVEHILYSINSPIGPVVRLFSNGEAG